MPWSTRRFKLSGGGKSSIRSGKPPHPDITCCTDGSCRLAFELVQVVDKGMAQGVSDQIGIQSLLREACNGLPRDRSTRLKRCLHNALVGIWFVDCALRKARKAVIPDIIRVLEKVDRKTEGALPLTGYASLRPIVRRLMITRGEFVGPGFYVSAGGSFGDPVVERVREKFLKSYHTSVPIELLAFYQLQPVAPDALWLPQLHEFVISNVGRSPFRTVWVYDAVQHKVRYMYPLIEGKGKVNAPSRV